MWSYIFYKFFLKQNIHSRKTSQSHSKYHLRKKEDAEWGFNIIFLNKIPLVLICSNFPSLLHPYFNLNVKLNCFSIFETKNILKL